MWPTRSRFIAGTARIRAQRGKHGTPKMSSLTTTGGGWQHSPRTRSCRAQRWADQRLRTWPCRGLLSCFPSSTCAFELPRSGTHRRHSRRSRADLRRGLPARRSTQPLAAARRDGGQFVALDDPVASGSSASMSRCSRRAFRMFARPSTSPMTVVTQPNVSSGPALPTRIAVGRHDLGIDLAYAGRRRLDHHAQTARSWSAGCGLPAPSRDRSSRALHYSIAPPGEGAIQA